MKKSVKKLVLGIIAATTLGLTSSAFADITGLKLTFGGGCLRSNPSGGCTLKVRVSGFDFTDETLVLYTAPNSSSRLKRGYKSAHSISDSGVAFLRVKNVPGGCFQVRTGPNGNDLPDANSNIMCEK